MGQGLTFSVLGMLVIMLSINIGLAMTDYAVASISDLDIMDVDNTPLANYYTGGLDNGTSTVTSDLLPDDNTVVGDTGNTFTDTFITARTFIKSSLGSLGFLGSVLGQPAGFLRRVGVPSAITLSIQIIWSITFIILVTAWLVGRS